MDMRPGGDFGRTVFETIRQGILVVDEQLRVVASNPAFRQLFELDEDEASGMPFVEMDGGALAESGLADALQEVVATGEPLNDHEVQQNFPRIGRRIFITDARRIEDDGGASLALVGFTDVTEQRRAERARELYAHEVARSNRDLEDFAHAASHDLQEPLRKVRAFADRLVSSFAETELSERQRDHLARMSAAAARMQQRIDDLLGLARVSRSKPETRSVDLNAVVRDVLADMEQHVAESGAEIETGPLPMLQADPAQLELVFQNLISNSLKYARQGVSPRIGIRSREVAAPAADDRVWHEIVVEDNGIGFDPQYAQRIFRPFERLHGRDEFDGSGIGLSVCRRVVEIHGGKIVADGRPGEGATFTILLPETQLQPESL